MKNTSRVRGKSRQTKVKRIPPTAESARDEGPRLLPLGDRVSEPSKLEHYLDLADAALGLKEHTESKRRLTSSEHD